MKDITALLQKLDSVNGKPKAGKVDFKELKSLKEKSFLKLKPGKHNLVFICPEGAEDPFVFWGYHNSLEEPAYYSVPCNEFNKNEGCTVCSVVKDLRTEDYDGNKHLWHPIRQQIEYYAPVVDIDNLSAGLRWLRISKSVMSQMTEWLKNLEKGEEPFYSDEEPQKIIINYDNTAEPVNQYKLDKKNFKPFSAEQLAEWRGGLKPLHDFMFSKSNEKINELVEGYFARVSEQIEASKSSTEDELSSLKKK